MSLIPEPHRERSFHLAYMSNPKSLYLVYVCSQHSILLAHYNPLVLRVYQHIDNCKTELTDQVPRSNNP